MVKFHLTAAVFLSFATGAEGFQTNRPTQAFVPRSLATPTSLHAAVEYEKTLHRLYYVPGIDDIPYENPDYIPSDHEDVDAYQLTNDEGVTVTAMKRGANMVELSYGGENYIWENTAGGCYYGQNSNNFPLRRGLILNGGVRFAAVTAEHGLYYDIDWDVQIDQDNDNEKSITFSIVDNEINRLRARNHSPSHPVNANPTPVTGLSDGQFNHYEKDGSLSTGEMTRYPTTNMEFQFKITLRAGEDFARLRMSVKNPSTDVKAAEAWLPMTFPVTEESIILSHQKLRWRRDNWCFDYNTPNIVTWENHADTFDKPLNWPTGGIFYDFPRKDGLFHGVTTKPAEGKGIVCYAPDDITKPGHYTKMWAWGKKGEDLNSLTEGRPAQEYYEPWSSGTNFAFFQPSEFQPSTETSWELALVPINGGLVGSDKDTLLGVVDTEMENRKDAFADIPGVEVTPIATSK